MTFVTGTIYPKSDGSGWTSISIPVTGDPHLYIEVLFRQITAASETEDLRIAVANLSSGPVTDTTVFYQPTGDALSNIAIDRSSVLDLRRNISPSSTPFSVLRRLITLNSGEVTLLHTGVRGDRVEVDYVIRYS
jgi:hypothetical protein